MSILPLIGDTIPFLCLVAFQSVIVFGVAVMDAANASAAGMPQSNAFYAAVVQALASLVYLAVRIVSRFRQRGRLVLAARDPLGSILPTSRGVVAASWRALTEASRAEAARLLDARDAESAEDLESFVMVIHTMKAPVAAVSLLAERAERTGEPLRPIDLKLEAEELDRLLELALGRIRLGDFERDTKIETVELRELVSSSVRRTRRIFIARGISVTISEGEIAAETDRKWMGFILDQLIVNAAKYARSSVRVQVSRADGVAEIAVEDDGPGIPVEERGRLFSRSFVGTTGRRADESGARSSGYGLHLASRATEKLGARVALQEVPGGGTRAVVTLPLGRDRFS